LSFILTSVRIEFTFTWRNIGCGLILIEEKSTSKKRCAFLKNIIVWLVVLRECHQRHSLFYFLRYCRRVLSISFSFRHILLLSLFLSIIFDQIIKDQQLFWFLTDSQAINDSYRISIIFQFAVFANK